MNLGRLLQALRPGLRIPALLALAGALAGCRSDNLWFNDTSPKLGSVGPSSHVPSLETEWRANDPASFR